LPLVRAAGDTSLASLPVIGRSRCKYGVKSGSRAVYDNCGRDHREREKQAELRQSCRSDAERASAAGKFDGKRIGELRRSEKGRAGRHERARYWTRCSTPDQYRGYR
jgi:hypothetical protein